MDDGFWKLAVSVALLVVFVAWLLSYDRRCEHAGGHLVYAGSLAACLCVRDGKIIEL